MTEAQPVQGIQRYSHHPVLGLIQTTWLNDSLISLTLSDAAPEGVESPWLTSLVDDFITGKQNRPEVAPEGTPFQKAVWNTLLAIPVGETRSYRQIALAAGFTTSHSRAVASAIGANPVGIFIPCHRVIGSDGSLTGYEWGLERKRWLLEQEAKS